MPVRAVFLLATAVATAAGQSDSNWLTEKPVAVFSIPADNVCGKLVHAESGQPAENLRLELKPLSYEFGRPRASMVRINVGKTVRKCRSGQEGKFDLRGMKPGTYMVRVDSSSDGAWGEFKILPRSGHNSCPLSIALEKGQKTFTLSLLPDAKPF